MRIQYAIALVFTVCACAPEHPETIRTKRRDRVFNMLYYISSEEATLRSATYSISAIPQQDVYFEGERVYLEVRIDTIGDIRKTTLRQGANYRTAIALWRNGTYVSEELTKQYSSTSGIDLTFEWDNPDINGLIDLEVQVPALPLQVGDYRGFVDLGVTSNWFRFKVRRCPDSLRSFYDKAELLSRNYYLKPDSITTPIAFDLLRETSEKEITSAYVQLAYERSIYQLANTRTREIENAADADSLLLISTVKKIANHPNPNSGLKDIAYLILRKLTEGRGEHWNSPAAVGVLVAEIGNDKVHQIAKPYLTQYREAGEHALSFPCGPGELAHHGWFKLEHMLFNAYPHIWRM